MKLGNNIQSTGDFLMFRSSLVVELGFNTTLFKYILSQTWDRTRFVNKFDYI